ncbi:sensor histidine kinase [Actinoplanes sp. GCM10030250]|uniref:sensor histidine kinase n=1 Tax=Actinoplanes sp. GCM10030250 TaxID=3273376 RepID=UPI003608F784
MMSRASRVDWYMRGSLYALYATVPLAIGSQVGARAGNAGLIAGTLALALVAASISLLHQAINFRLGRAARPTWRVALAAGLCVATVLASWPAYEAPDSTYPMVVTFVVAAFLTAWTPAISTFFAIAIAAAGWLVAAGPAILRDGTAFAAHSVLFILLLGMVATSRSTVWMLDLVWQLDDAQQVRADLAVAEERLRFARDLHDVAGRALSVVALKAELAAKLGARGRPEAVEEMHEVRRIAQDSLAELRAVVSGLRTAQLDEELAGARSLLAAAGITCRVIGEAGGLGPRTQTALGWAVREATTNVLRHSEAHECTITLDRSADGTVTLTMTNDGAAGAQSGYGNGLTGLTERITAVGGTVGADRVPPDRFQVEVRLPATEEVTA